MEKMRKRHASLWSIYLVACIAFIVLLYCLLRILQSSGKGPPVDLTDNSHLLLENRAVIRKKRNGLKKSTNKLWTIYKDKHNDWVVPYELKRGPASENLENEEKQAILYVMALIMRKTCLRFMEKEEWRNYETSKGHAAKEWLEIRKDHVGCLTHTGRNIMGPVGKHTIHLKPHCIIRHTHKPNYQKIGRLLLTALGVDLEHRRNDRSTYVTINKKNIRKIKTNHWYFEKNNPTEFDNYDISYNFLSVMHDRKDTWGRKVKGRSLTVIKPTTGYEAFGDTMGTEEYLSDKDYLLLNRMYECSQRSAANDNNNDNNNNNHRPNDDNSQPNDPGSSQSSKHDNDNNSHGNGDSGGSEGAMGALGGILGHLHHFLNNRYKASGGSREDSSSSSEEEDKAKDCKMKEFLCVDKDYMGMMAEMCKATCKVTGGAINYEPDCLDVGDHCRHKHSECDHSATYDAMTLECPHTCGRCKQHRLMMAGPAPNAMGMPSMPMGGLNPMMAGYNPLIESMMGGYNPMMISPMMAGMGGMRGGMADPSASVPGVMHPQLMQTGMINPGMGGTADPSSMVPGVMHPQLMQTGMMGKKK